MSDSVVIVTGGSRGIGASVCRKLGRLGCHTIVVNYAANKSAADKVVSEIEAEGGRAVAVQGDVGSESDILKMFEEADKLGRLAGPGQQCRCRRHVPAR